MPLALVQEEWDMHTAHNTFDCCKHEKDGTCKKGIRKGQCNSTVPDKNIVSAYVKLSMMTARLKKSLKIFKKVL